MAYNALIFLVKQPALSDAEFVSYYETHHLPWAAEQLGPNLAKVHRRQYIDRSVPPLVCAHPDYDFVVEIVYADEAAAMECFKILSEPKMAEVFAGDEARFVVREKTTIVKVDMKGPVMGEAGWI